MISRKVTYIFLLLNLFILCIVLLVIMRNSYIITFPPSQAAFDHIPAFQKYNINCKAIYDMDPVEMSKSLAIRRTQRVEHKDEVLVNVTSDCPSFIRSRGYDDVCVSQEDKDFPIAYSLVVHKSALMVERLIRALYSPFNIYCIHYDKKSSAGFISALEALARCLPNVFITSKIEYVVYGHISRMIGDINCIHDLLKTDVKWKYIINLCGQDFPLKSNSELVSELRKLKGTNMMETSRPSYSKRMRSAFHHKLEWINGVLDIVKTDQKKTPPPHGIEMFTGSAYFVLSRDFAEFVDSSPLVKDFLDWSEDTYDPEEHFWATLVRLPGVPGEVPRSHPDITNLMSKTRMNSRKVTYIFLLLNLFVLCIVLLVIMRNSYIITFPPSQAAFDHIPAFQKYNINCKAIYDMDPVEMGKSLAIRRTQRVKHKDEVLVNVTSDCPSFIRSRGYDDVCVSQEDKDFPIAYSLVVHKSALMVERLIRALYSPFNIYCIHYDKKSSAGFVSALEALARCLPNVFITSKIEYVVYGHISRTIGDINCIHDLLKTDVKWKYVINLCGQDFPLKSNSELVSELRKLKGTNMMETCRPSYSKRMRSAFHHKLEWINGVLDIVKTDQKKTPPPHGIEMFTGSAYFVLSRDFAEFVDSSPLVKDFLDWSEDTYDPEEHFWATLVRLPGVPGEVPRSHPDITEVMSKTRLVKWQEFEGRLYPPCTGIHIHGICIYASAEMRWMLDDGHWIANKFDINMDPVIVQCLEETLQGREKLYQSSHTCQSYSLL